jgi:hypothetical protein
MRFFILFFAVLACCSQSFGQKRCPQYSRLYTFYKGNEPRLFAEPLGRRPEFPFLQKINGVTSPTLFIKAIRDTVKQHKYAREFKAFDLLLRNSGFTHGYKDLHLKSVTKVYINPGTRGNLGFYDKEKDVINYEYVILSPAGEGPHGTSAWKLTNASGCFLYILHTCGNGFYPNGSTGGNEGGACCKTISVQPQINVPEQKNDSVKRPVRLTMNYYEGKITPSREKKKNYDTLVQLIRHKDTLVYFKDRNIVPWKLEVNGRPKQIRVCKDTSIHLNIPITADIAGQTDTSMPVNYLIADTVYRSETTKFEKTCHSKWEITIDAGRSFNSIPRLNDPTQHTQTNGAQLFGEFGISRILSHWFQLGISASYLILSYQDDILYPGTVPGTYNTVYLGKPIIPVKLFGKFTLSRKPTGFQAKVSLSLGYSIPTNGKIVDNGTTLTTNPNLKGDFTAGFKMGVDYFFSCRFGVGFAFEGQYFNNKSDLINYSIFALPVTGGIRLRF